MSVYVPMLVRPSLPRGVRRGLEQRIYDLKLPQGSRVTWEERLYRKHYARENYWARFARMRQAAIDGGLQPGDDWVLWIDADITKVPVDLFERLSEATHALVAPLVVIENREYVNYDTAGTRPSFEHRSGTQPPEPGVYEMYSLGGCVLVPADVHRQVRFAAQADDDDTANTEWTSLCVGAAGLGYKVLWDTRVVVKHADLKAHGEEWH